MVPKCVLKCHWCCRVSHSQGTREHPPPSPLRQRPPPVSRAVDVRQLSSTKTRLQWCFPRQPAISCSSLAITIPVQGKTHSPLGFSHHCFPLLLPNPLPHHSLENQHTDQRTACFGSESPILRPQQQLLPPHFAEKVWGYPDDWLPSCPSSPVLTNCCTLMTSMVPLLSKPPVRRAELPARL